MGAGQGYLPNRAGEDQDNGEPGTTKLFRVGVQQDGRSCVDEVDELEDAAGGRGPREAVTSHTIEETTEISYLRSMSSPSGRIHAATTMQTRRSVSDQSGITGEGGEAISMVSRQYSFSVRDKILTGPPPPLGTQRGRRRSSSSFVQYVGRRLGGSFLYEPEDMVDMEMVDGGRGGEGEGECVRCKLSCLAQKTLKQVFEGINPEEIVDYHVHLVGHGDSGSGCHLHSSTKTWRYPLRKIKTVVFMAAAQTPDMVGGDVQYVSRLVRLARHFVPAAIFDKTRSGYRSGKLCLLPFDKFYEKDGRDNMDKTTLYVPNEYAIQMAIDFPNLFVPFGSVNPYRPDALEELDKCARCGVKVIKWLPNSMGIDPSDESCVPFYHRMRELDLALLVHVGEEHAVDAAYINNKLGNPLLLRKPLDCGVKVIGAHCATEGSAVDFEKGGGTAPCFSLFLRLLREDRYKGLLFGDISAICGFKRLPYLNQLLQATDVHDRLVYGSDYPVPAINLVVQTSKLLRQGFITQEENVVLNELYNYNPLLFDFACKRLVTGPEGERFPPSVFKAHPKLPPYKYDCRLLGTPV